MVDHHVSVHVVRQSIDVWRVLVLCRSLVHLHFFFGEIGHFLEGIDRDEHRANVGLKNLDWGEREGWWTYEDGFPSKTLLEVVHDGGIVEGPERGG